MSVFFLLLPTAESRLADARVGEMGADESRCDEIFTRVEGELEKERRRERERERERDRKREESR